jgi:hypothetical protein
MAPLPTELWLIIFDIVLEEGIIWLDHCDHTTFPHISNSLSSSVSRHHQRYDSYYRLRLVCRKFNTLLGARPWQSFSDSSSLPFPITTRVLYLDLEALSKPHFQRLLPGTLAYRRLIHLDVTCNLSQSTDNVNLSKFLHAGRVFSNVQRLTLRPLDCAYAKSQFSFWTPLNRTFPSLVTLVVVNTQQWLAILQEAGDDVPCFERLEILYLNREIPYSSCHFPRLRHASVWQCTPDVLETLIRSPHLESLLIRAAYFPRYNIDVTSCTRLKLLGFLDCPFTGLCPLGPDHPVEHIWIYSPDSSGNPEFFKPLSRRLSKISRITVDFSSSNSAHHSRRVAQFQAIGLRSFGLTMGPLTMRPSGFPILVIERVGSVGTKATPKKIWRKICR